MISECTLHNSIVLAIFLPKIIKVGGNLTKLLQKQFWLVFFWNTVYNHKYRKVLNHLSCTSIILSSTPKLLKFFEIGCIPLRAKIQIVKYLRRSIHLSHDCDHLLINEMLELSQRHIQLFFQPSPQLYTTTHQHNTVTFSLNSFLHAKARISYDNSVRPSVTNRYQFKTRWDKKLGVESLIFRDKISCRWMRGIPLNEGEIQHKHNSTATQLTRYAIADVHTWQ